MVEQNTQSLKYKEPTTKQEGLTMGLIMTVISG